MSCIHEKDKTDRQTDTEKESQLVSWCFKPSQPQGIISGLKTTQVYLLVIHETNFKTFHIKLLNNSLNTYHTNIALTHFIFCKTDPNKNSLWVCSNEAHQQQQSSSSSSSSFSFPLRSDKGTVSFTLNFEGRDPRPLQQGLLYILLSGARNVEWYGQSLKMIGTLLVTPFGASNHLRPVNVTGPPREYWEGCFSLLLIPSQPRRFYYTRSNIVMLVSQLVGALSPVNHRGLHQG